MPKNTTEEKDSKIHIIRQIMEFPGTKHKMMARVYPSICKVTPTSCFAWELERNYLLFTAGLKKGQDLVITAHGCYSDIISDDIFKIPDGYSFTALGPHDWEIQDTGLTSLLNRSMTPYGIISRSHCHFRQVNRIMTATFNHTQNLMSVSGTTKPGHFRDYYLSKYENDTIENYFPTREFIELNQVVTQPKNHRGFFSARTMDVVTIRNRFISREPSLKNLVESLARKGIVYERIILSFCRGRSRYPLMKSKKEYYTPIT